MTTPENVIGYVVKGDRGVHPASAHVRLIQRMREPRAVGIRFIELSVRDFVYGVDTTEYSAIIVQRDAMDATLVPGFLVTACAREIPFFVELDDDLISESALPRLLAGGYDERALRGLRTLAEHATAISVSTESLRKRLSDFVPSSTVVPNELDDSLWSIPVGRPNLNGLSPREVRVLYMGSPSHTEDLALLAPVFDSLTAADGRRIVLEIIGVTFEAKGQFRRIPIPVGSDNYPDFVRWLREQSGRWQLGVAPLVESDFNDSKSDLKFLEYTALGLPMIASNSGPYRGLDSVGATLVDATVGQWREAIIRAVDDQSASARKLATAKSFVFENRMLSTGPGMTAWLGLIAPGRAAGAAERAEPTSLGGSFSPRDRGARRVLATLRASKGGRFAERAARSLKRRASVASRRMAGQSPLAARTGELEVDFALHASPDVTCLLEGLRAARDVVIVIPVFNGGSAVSECIESIVRNTPGRRIVVLDDCSTERFTLDLLTELEAGGAVEVRRNSTNLGYTANANLAMTIDSSADLVLINSDTLVGPLWLERLRWTAYSMPKVAGVSAFSDSAGAYSLPVTPEPTVWPRPPEWQDVARFVSQNADSWALEGPTIHGFCCYFAREALDEIGPFDREMFPRGYGEENEWSMRALGRGYLNLGAPHVFVHHAQGASFGSARMELIDRARRIIDQLHPSFGRLVNEWWGGAGFATIRINSARLKHEVVGATVIRRELTLSLAEANALDERTFASNLIRQAIEVVEITGPEGDLPAFVAEVCGLLRIPLVEVA